MKKLILALTFILSTLALAQLTIKFVYEIDQIANNEVIFANDWFSSGAPSLPVDPPPFEYLCQAQVSKSVGAHVEVAIAPIRLSKENPSVNFTDLQWKFKSTDGSKPKFSDKKEISFDHLMGGQHLSIQFLNKETLNLHHRLNVDIGEYQVVEVKNAKAPISQEKITIVNSLLVKDKNTRRFLNLPKVSIYCFKLK